MYEPAAKLERKADKDKTTRFRTDPLSYRELAHPPLPRQSPRRLLLPQHPDILPSLCPRHRGLGISRLPRLGLLNLQSSSRQHPQHCAASPFPPSQPTLQRLGRILLRCLVDTGNPRLQPRDLPEGEPRIRRRFLLRSLQPRRRPQKQRKRCVYPSHSPRR